DLPEAGDARTARVVGVDGLRISAQLLFGDWSRPHNTHVTSEDVEELWEFIQAGLSQNGANRGDTRIIAQLPRLDPLSCGGAIRFKVAAQAFLRVGRHRAKFQTIETLSIETDTSMSKQHRTRRDADHRQGANEEKRSEQHDQQQRQKNICYAFGSETDWM